MLGKNFKLLFYLKRRSNYVEGMLPVYLRISINGTRSELTVGRQCEPEKWNNAACRKIGMKADVREFNAFLDSIQAKGYEVHRKLVDKGERITAEDIRDAMTGITGRPKMILEIFLEHNRKIQALIGKGFAKGTVTKYKTCYDHTAEYIKVRFGKNDLEIQKLNYEFITDYEFWLKSEKSCAHNTVMKYLTNFKKIVMICVKSGWLTQDPFSNFKMSRQVVNRNALTEAELSRIAEKDFENERLNQIRDVFLFCCFTGLAYIDVYKLKRKDIIDGINGEKWLIINRHKTDSQSRIPILPFALEILSRYEHNSQSHPDSCQSHLIKK